MTAKLVVSEKTIEKIKFEFSESASLYMAHCAAPEISGNSFWRKLTPS